MSDQPDSPLCTALKAVGTILLLVVLLAIALSPFALVLPFLRAIP